MRLTVLGSGAACPSAGQNSSGYLIETGSGDANRRRILLDCGHGIASALLAARPAADIDDIWISHMHADHFIDVLALRFRISREMGGVPESDRRITLHLPPGGRDCLRAILDAVTFPQDFCDNTFTVTEYAPGQTYDMDGVRVRTVAAQHYIPAFALRVEADGVSLTYTGDTAPSADVVALAAGSDLFVCEATLDLPETRDVLGHSTPEQAATMATDAGARRLLLTHFWFETDTAAFGERARRACAIPVDVAQDGNQYDV